MFTKDWKENQVQQEVNSDPFSLSLSIKDEYSEKYQIIDEGDCFLSLYCFQRFYSIAREGGWRRNNFSTESFRLASALVSA